MVRCSALSESTGYPIVLEQRNFECHLISLRVLDFMEMNLFVVVSFSSNGEINKTLTVIDEVLHCTLPECFTGSPLCTSWI